MRQTRYGMKKLMKADLSNTKSDFSIKKKNIAGLIKLAARKMKPILSLRNLLAAIILEVNKKVMPILNL